MMMKELTERLTAMGKMVSVVTVRVISGDNGADEVVMVGHGDSKDDYHSGWRRGHDSEASGSGGVGSNGGDEVSDGRDWVVGDGDYKSEREVDVSLGL